ncbi:MAG: PAS domain S-box protein [Armatimonadota bacterium]|nr:PAS domain S-box protein [Armatimonadota bacterium]
MKEEQGQDVPRAGNPQPPPRNAPSQPEPNPDPTAESVRAAAESQFTLREIVNGVDSLLWLAQVRREGDRFRWRVRPYNPEAAARLLRREVVEQWYERPPWHDGIPREDYLRVTQTSRQALLSGAPRYSQEFRYRRGDGTLGWMAEEVRIRPAAEGCWSVFGVCTDVSERRAAEEALRYVTRNASCLLWYADVAEVPGEPGRYVWHTRVLDEEGAQRFLPLERRPGETYAQAWARSSVADEVHRGEELFHEAVRRGASHYSREMHCLDAHGQMRCLREEAQLEQTGRGKFRVSGVCTDVTEQKALQQALEEGKDIRENARSYGGDHKEYFID